MCPPLVFGAQKKPGLDRVKGRKTSRDQSHFPVARATYTSPCARCKKVVQNLRFRCCAPNLKSVSKFPAFLIFSGSRKPWEQVEFFPTRTSPIV